MNKVVDININGEKHKAMILSVFEYENRTFCLYALPGENGLYKIKGGKVEGDVVVDIANSEERAFVNNLGSALIKGIKIESGENMEKNYFSVKDEKGNDRKAYILGEYEIEGKNYLVYSVEEENEYDGLYVKKIVVNESGEEDLLDIEDTNERETVFTVIRNLVENEGV